MDICLFICSIIKINNLKKIMKTLSLRMCLIMLIIGLVLGYVANLTYEMVKVKDHYQLGTTSTDYGNIILWDLSYDEFPGKLENLDLVVTLSRKGSKWDLTNPKPDINYNDIVVVGNYLHNSKEFVGYGFLSDR